MCDEEVRKVIRSVAWFLSSSWARSFSYLIHSRAQKKRKKPMPRRTLPFLTLLPFRSSLSSTKLAHASLLLLVGQQLMRKNDALSGSSLHSLTYRRLKDPDNELDKRRQLSFHYSKAAFVEVSEISGSFRGVVGSFLMEISAQVCKINSFKAKPMDFFLHLAKRINFVNL